MGEVPLYTMNPKPSALPTITCTENLKTLEPTPENQNPHPEHSSLNAQSESRYTSKPVNMSIFRTVLEVPAPPSVCVSMGIWALRAFKVARVCVAQRRCIHFSPSSASIHLAVVDWIPFSPGYPQCPPTPSGMLLLAMATVVPHLQENAPP